MKKAFVSVCTLFAIMLCGCYINVADYNSEDYDTVIKNNSSNTISFYVNSASTTTYSLTAGSSTSIKMTKSDTITLVNNPRATSAKSYDYTYNHWKITISDMTYYTYKIVNSSSLSITLSETNGMLTNTYNGTLVIPAGVTESVNVYTSSPSFSAVYTTSSATANCTVNSKVVTVY
jgi:hypothetical protein